MRPDLDSIGARNAALGAVEQFDTLTNPPERLVAYVGAKIEGSNRHRLTTWTGHDLGTVYLGTGWRVRSYIGSHMFQAYATIQGVEYTGRTFGNGMSISLRETAASKRKRKESCVT